MAIVIIAFTFAARRWLRQFTEDGLGELASAPSPWCLNGRPEPVFIPTALEETAPLKRSTRPAERHSGNRPNHTRHPARIFAFCAWNSSSVSTPAVFSSPSFCNCPSMSSVDGAAGGWAYWGWAYCGC